MSQLVISIDCSTSSSKVIVWNQAGQMLAEARTEITLNIPKEGYGEQDPETWWQATKASFAKLRQGFDLSEIKALVITHQRESFACLDSQGRALRPGMLWLDTRAKEQVEQFGVTEIHKKTGKPANPTPAFYKLLWMLEHEPEVIAKTVKVVDVHAFLSHRLVGKYVSPLASADPLGLINLSESDFDDELLKVAGLERSQLPELCLSGDVIGELLPEVAEEIGLPKEVLLVAGGGDGQCAGLGAGVGEPGVAYLNLGTGLISGIYSESYEPSLAYRAMVGTIPGSFNYEFFVGAGTYMVNWFKEHMNLAGAENPELYWGNLAGSVEIGSGGLFTLPYWNGALTPYWDQNATGAIVGFSGVHGNAHLFRSILEGIAFELRLCIEMASPNLEKPLQRLIAMGGGTKSELWCQIIADNLEIPVVISRAVEATSLGAAMLGFYGLGHFESVAAAAKEMSGTGKQYDPNPAQSEQYEGFYQTYKAIYPGLRETFAMIARLK